jgi:methylaspartate mutase epsilon subunit
MQKIVGHTILLGGIGGDSHSVGLTVLRHALMGSGYRVHYLGIQVQLKEFFELASMCNVVMISSMDGHARYYLSEFANMRAQYKAYQALWYLGGNLHTSTGSSNERYYIEMGFDRVFLKFTDVTTVLSLLEKDLYGFESMPDCPTLWEAARHSRHRLVTKVSDETLEASDFTHNRWEVLDGWKTGPRAKDMEENAVFLSQQPTFAGVQASVKSGQSSILIQPRSGVPLLQEQIKLFKTFKNCGAKVLSYQVDSLTRNNNYIGAQEAIRESGANGHATINGFPVINHGVLALRQIISEVKSPIQTRHSTRDPRLLAEVSYAGGVTAFEGGAICYNIPYYKDYPLDESVKTWQYVDYLTGKYFSRFGVVLDREFFGTLTATLIPPCLAIAVDLIEAILAVKQGVKCVSLGYAEQGHRTQDIAAIRTLAQMGQELIQHLGYKDVQVNTVFHQYMAAFPDNPERAAELIYNSAVTGALSGATRMMLKTPVEAYRIPTLKDNVDGISLVSRGVSAANPEMINEARVADECAHIRRETQSILESVIFSGAGSIAEGVVASFRRGFIDIPFSPSIYNRGEVVTARDAEGAVRFLSFGNLQFDWETREYHADKMSDRRRAAGSLSTKQDYLLVEHDVMQIARGQYESWPLHE